MRPRRLMAPAATMAVGVRSRSFGSGRTRPAGAGARTTVGVPAPFRGADGRLGELAVGLAAGSAPGSGGAIDGDGDNDAGTGGLGGGRGLTCRPGARVAG